MTIKYELDSVLFFTSKIKHTVCYSRFIPDAGPWWCSGNWCSCVQCSAYDHDLESNCPGAVLWGKYCWVFHRQCNYCLQTGLLEEGWDFLFFTAQREQLWARLDPYVICKYSNWIWNWPFISILCSEEEEHMELYLLCPYTPSCHGLHTHTQEKLNIYVATGYP